MLEGGTGEPNEDDEGSTATSTERTEAHTSTRTPNDFGAKQRSGTVAAGVDAKGNADESGNLTTAKERESVHVSRQWSVKWTSSISGGKFVPKALKVPVQDLTSHSIPHFIEVLFLLFAGAIITLGASWWLSGSSWLSLAINVILLYVVVAFSFGGELFVRMGELFSSKSVIDTTPLGRVITRSAEQRTSARSASRTRRGPRVTTWLVVALACSGSIGELNSYCCTAVHVYASPLTMMSQPVSAYVEGFGRSNALWPGRAFRCRTSSTTASRAELLSMTHDRSGWLHEAFDGFAPLPRYQAMSPPELLTSPPVALDTNAFLEATARVMHTPSGRSKELIGVVRGTATGKTTALEWTLREANLVWPDVLCMGVTFNHNTATSKDLDENIYGYRGWQMTYGMGVVARMATGVFDHSIEEMYEALSKPSVHKLLRQRRGTKDAIETVGSCVQYLLERTNKSAVLLAVDEVMEGEEAILNAFPPSLTQMDRWRRSKNQRTNYDALKILRDLLLEKKTTTPSALIVSSLERLNLTESGRFVRPLPVPSRLAPEDVLSQWWFKDCSMENSSFTGSTLTLSELQANNPRTTIYKPADDTSKQRLLRLAALPDSLPRGLQFMKQQLDVKMKDVQADPDGLKPITMDIDTTLSILNHALTTFYLKSNKAPHELPPAIMVAWLFHKDVFPSTVTDFIRSSIFTNSVEGDERIYLETCIFSMKQLIGRISTSMEKTAHHLRLLVDYILKVCSVSPAQVQRGEPQQEGTPLEVAVMRMLQVKLAAKVEDPGTESRQVSLQDLLYPGWYEKAEGADQAAASAVFRAVVSLPDKNNPNFCVDVVQPTARLNANPKKFFQLLNGIDLSGCRFVVLRGAPYDCFDVGLLFVDARTGRVCLWLGDMKSAKEGAIIAQLLDQAESADSKRLEQGDSNSGGLAEDARLCKEQQE